MNIKNGFLPLVLRFQNNVQRFQNNVQTLCRGDAMRLPGDARYRPYPPVHHFGNAVLVNSLDPQQVNL